MSAIISRLYVSLSPASRDTRDEGGQLVIPAPSDHVAIGKPVLDDVPEAVEREQLVPGVGQLQCGYAGSWSKDGLPMFGTSET